MDLGEHSLPVNIGSNLQLAPLIEIGYGAVMIAPMKKSFRPAVPIIEVLMEQAKMPAVKKARKSTQYDIASAVGQVLTELRMLQAAVDRIEARLNRPNWLIRLWRKYVRTS